MADTTPKAVDDCHELLRWIIPRLDKFPRSRRFTLGERIETGLLDVLEALTAAAYRQDKRLWQDLANRRINRQIPFQGPGVFKLPIFDPAAGTPDLPTMTLPHRTPGPAALIILATLFLSGDGGQSICMTFKMVFGSVASSFPGERRWRKRAGCSASSRGTAATERKKSGCS
ncbi:hypothetical protein sS8_0781 [Methylocaldum marinum]|uniref:Uncharacterized protein n=1 Tax=Methylocaldum marinum TaxID=1432792 RepID=A0A250KMH1_9GAMM|nr:hypothetical protein sS8_0781 [Methylocaldum marinum]